ncbi:MAG: hypothetical protein ACQEW8_10145 [Actinomycetota bacterium]
MTAIERTATEATASRGTTTIRAKALQHLAVGLVRDATGVPARDVTVGLADERGALRISITLPLALGTSPGDTIVERGDEVRRRVIEGFDRLGTRTVRTVDVRFSGVRRIRDRRVA